MFGLVLGGWGVAETEGSTDGETEGVGPLVVPVGPVQDETNPPTREPTTAHRTHRRERPPLGVCGPGILPTSRQ